MLTKVVSFYHGWLYLLRQGQRISTPQGRYNYSTEWAMLCEEHMQTACANVREIEFDIKFASAEGPCGACEKEKASAQMRRAA